LRKEDLLARKYAAAETSAGRKGEKLAVMPQTRGISKKEELSCENETVEPVYGSENLYVSGKELEPTALVRWGGGARKTLTEKGPIAQRKSAG